ncbi:ecto-NOX disulfide-thiol exchanger 2 isoform X5 [Hypanus sabinus]|uniref:ecto-NOX disulfide-thiol exchanger 2 isoform X5 n=1 Tax=Hypanus sabinus TaxID=79690 RepID=UPI0028C41564|nr:ecto-NOX disulfide-thiol exchanger 2 isoform X5 [Hypanus sabinus]
MAAGTEGLEGIVLGPSQISMSVTDTTAWATAMNNLGITPVPLVSDPICMPAFEHGLGLVAGMAPVNPTMTGIGLLRPVVPQELPVVKEIIHCARCTLFPANPNLPPPATRDRPPGCKTVFVGGLPENATEEVIREVFEQCGTITALRKSKKNFCHIRFAEEFMVDKAIYLSGYRMRLGSSTDKKDTGRLHVDFAQARDDFYEWECKQRMFAREERHRRMLEDEQLRPPSPAPIMHYSEHEASLMTEKLKDESRFSEATSVLLAWFERGEVTRRSANNFYSMIQSVNSHSRRLMSEKAAHEQEMEDAKERFKNALAGILTGPLAAQARALKEENDSLRWQLDVYRNEVELLKQEQGIFYQTDTSHPKDQQLQFQQQAMQGMQQQLLALQEEYRKKELELEKVKEEKAQVQALLASLKEKRSNAFTQSRTTSEGDAATRSLKSEKEALLVGIISAFLHVHPFGANIEYLWSYLQRLDAKISSGEIETLLLQLPNMFKQEFTGVGATLEKKWKFCGFEGIKCVSQ